jgi:hypothetical protein
MAAAAAAMNHAAVARMRHREYMRLRRARLKAQLEAEFELTPEEKEYQSNPAAYGPQSTWPILEQWAIKFGWWMSSEPWKCGQTR